jgi:excisionase family DNA binding protein
MAKPAYPLAQMLTLTQFAGRCAVSVKTTRRWVDDGQLPAYRLGGQIRIAEEDAFTFIAMRRR